MKINLDLGNIFNDDYNETSICLIHHAANINLMGFRIIFMMIELKETSIYLKHSAENII